MRGGVEPGPDSYRPEEHFVRSKGMKGMSILLFIIAGISCVHYTYSWIQIQSMATMYRIQLPELLRAVGVDEMSFIVGYIFAIVIAVAYVVAGACGLKKKDKHLLTIIGIFLISLNVVDIILTGYLYGGNFTTIAQATAKLWIPIGYLICARHCKEY